MKIMKIKRLLIAGLMAVLLIGFAGCYSEAEKVNHNISEAGIIANAINDILPKLELLHCKQGIVLCRDCRWWQKYKGGLQGRCALHEINPTGAWFCANGQKLEGEKDDK